MKLIAVILLTCFIRVNSQGSLLEGNADEAGIVTRVHSDHLPGFVVTFVENSIQQALGFFNNVLANLNQFVAGSLKIAEQILATTRDGLDKIVSSIQQKLEELRNLGEKVQECIDPHIPELEAIRSKARQDVQNCTAEADSYVQFIKDKVQNQTSAIGEAVESLRNIVDRCVHQSSLFAAIQCILSGGHDLYSSIAAIAANALDALRVATKQYLTIGFEARQCVKSVLAESEGQQAAILKNITQCINGTNADKDN